MKSPIPYLDLLILLASVFPAGFSFSVAAVFGKEREEKIGVDSLLFILLPFFVLLIVILSLRSELFSFRLPPYIFYLIALLFAPVCLFFEYLLNVIFIYLSTGKVYKGITIHSAWQTNLSVRYVLLITLIAVGEEMIFRNIWFAILERSFSLPGIVIVCLSAVFYGMNHLFFGVNAVLSKFISGLIYGGLYVFSGYSILIPITTHGIQNITLFLMTKKTDA